MASRIPGLTSGLKPPTSQTSLSKRRGVETTATQPADKRPRTAEDTQSNMIWLQHLQGILNGFPLTSCSYKWCQ